MKLGGMVDISVESQLTKFEKNRTGFEGGRREVVEGLGCILAAPPHENIWATVRGRLLNLREIIESSADIVLIEVEENCTIFEGGKEVEVVKLEHIHASPYTSVIPQTSDLSDCLTLGAFLT